MTDAEQHAARVAALRADLAKAKGEFFDHIRSMEKAQLQAIDMVHGLNCLASELSALGEKVEVTWVQSRQIPRHPSHN
jgi:hypothetical protein